MQKNHERRVLVSGDTCYRHRAGVGRLGPISGNAACDRHDRTSKRNETLIPLPHLARLTVCANHYRCSSLGVFLEPGFDGRFRGQTLKTS